MNRDELETVDLGGTATVDLEDRLTVLLEEEIPEAVEEAEEKGIEPEEYETYTSLRHTARVFNTAIQKWGGSEFVFKANLGLGEMLRATDRVTTAAARSGEDASAAAAKAGAHQLAMLEQGCVQKPPKAPRFNASEFPWQVGDWLLERFNQINSSGAADGEITPGNSSRTPNGSRRENG